MQMNGHETEKLTDWLTHLLTYIDHFTSRLKSHYSLFCTHNHCATHYRFYKPHGKQDIRETNKNTTVHSLSHLPLCVGSLLPPSNVVTTWRVSAASCTSTNHVQCIAIYARDAVSHSTVNS